MFTDLDGTLLDHDTYDWRSAAGTLDRLRQACIPVVLISSKTLDELAVYRQDIGLPDPVVAENGAAIEVPPGYFSRQCALDESPVNRQALQRVFETLRDAEGVSCIAFYELGATGIAHATGLTVAQSELANRRQASEPILWQDSDEALARFSAAVAKLGLRCVRGGRFVHLMGQTDKADAMKRLLAAYQTQWPTRSIKSIALGDSPNDLGMLRAADVAVVIPARHDRPMELPDHPCVLRPTLSGPAGWDVAMTTILNEHRHGE